MSSAAEFCAYQAACLVPIDGPPLSQAVVVCRAGQIAAVAGQQGSSRVVRGDAAALEAALARPDSVRPLGDVALLPALVNAHTHLELSDCPRPLGRAGQPLPEWIGQVMQHRRGRSPAAQAVAAGLAESRAAGVVALADIAQGDIPLDSYGDQSPRVAAFFEVLGFGAQRRGETLARAQAQLAAAAQHGGILCGISPHAPYSVHPQLLAQSLDLAGRLNLPVAMHLAESPEELELLRSRQGGFRRLLDAWGLWSAVDLLPSIGDYLAALARAPRALVIHGNFLDAVHIDWLAQRREHMSVVYCPRTHAYFGHPPYPLPRLLAAGARVAVGTDSRASNPDLDLFEELRLVATAFPELAPREVLRLGTQAAAEALGLGQELGTVTPGKRAAFLAISLADGPSTPDPEAAVLEGPKTERRVV